MYIDGVTSYNKRDIDWYSMFTLFFMVNTEYTSVLYFYLCLIAIIVYKITIKARTNSSNVKPPVKVIYVH